MKGYRINREGHRIPYLTFWQWLKDQNRRQDPVGDLSRDAIDDPHHKGSTPEWWLEHLMDSHYTCDSAFNALRQAWQEYDNLDYS